MTTYIYTAMTTGEEDSVMFECCYTTLEKAKAASKEYFDSLFEADEVEPLVWKDEDDYSIGNSGEFEEIHIKKTTLV